ncbi:hypothetical protein GQ671_08270 [Salinicoccus hispanicus]|uniref:HTH luxR-type domain-containing protein n=2 Tax=Salinicoccus hispanicus TaxID=157225 RepID=A0A6N8U0H1_9STAP|nr:hypothetical protein [Salinicoccus hispanicus]
MFPKRDIGAVMEAGHLIKAHKLLPEDHPHRIAGYIYAICTAEDMEAVKNLVCIDEQAFEVYLSFMRAEHVSEVVFDLPGEPEADDREAIAGAVSSLEDLSPREREVLTLLSKGKNNQEIAETLYISTHTVKNHVTKIFHKLNVSDRVGAISKVYSYLHK